ncbi:MULTISPECIES: hypothetical protein [Winogradskyella]|uniref:hypothetical protein n=1 Tax=Winogradskyella TaxID=286104 RepID=UPI0015C863FA|nr:MULTISPECIES: hypothetical protein [Winogradskyella]QXP77736.1 hypothetical protein H0I32_10915 [Winogradskyella sp. HaHa_3_26]
MAPIKFEENIKSKLEERTLSPSAEAWSKLSDRLDAEENKFKKSVFWWLSIAAGLLVMVAVSVQFFNNEDSNHIAPIVVEDGLIKETIENQKSDSKPKETIQFVEKENEVEKENKLLPTKKESQIIDYKKVTKKTFDDNKTELATVNNDSLTQDELAYNEAEELLREAQLKLAVADAIKTLKIEHTTVADNEIDSLLNIASKEIFKENLENDTFQTVDATKLLESVEDEMGQSFRTKVFEALKDSYDTVKTAVVDRNN